MSAFTTKKRIRLLLGVVFLSVTGCVIFQQGPAAGGFDFSAGGLDPKLERALEREGWPKPVYDFMQNPIDPALVALGRKLFYDVRLSSEIGRAHV